MINHVLKKRKNHFFNFFDDLLRQKKRQNQFLNFYDDLSRLKNVKINFQIFLMIYRV